VTVKRRSASVSAETFRQRWLLSFADLMTLLFAFFLVLYVSSGIGLNEPGMVRDSLRQTFGGQAPSPTELDELLARLEPELARLLVLEVLSLERGDKALRIVIHSRKLFDPGSSEINGRYDALLSFLATNLQAFDLSVAVEGHTDDQAPTRGGFSSNLALSSSRAVAVGEKLLAFGLRRSQLSVAGYGAERPVASNASSEGRGKNRRIVLRITPTVSSY